VRGAIKYNHYNFSSSLLLLVCLLACLLDLDVCFSSRCTRCVNGSKMIRSHSPELASKVLEEIASPAPTGKCMVVTAIRDPRLAVPSKFFEGQKTFLCDGQQSKNQVIDLYRKYLQSAGSRESSV
jgi:hypothetical protein